MSTRIITGVISAVVFLGLLILGGWYFKIFVALIAILAIAEFFKMRKLQILSLEGVLSVLACLSLVLPIGQTFFGMDSDANLMLFTFFVFIMLAAMVFSKNSYTFDDIGFPFLVAFFVGMGFQNLIAARQADLYIAFLALFMVWATDIGAYAMGKNMGKTKLFPSISPNKTVAGSMGGIIITVLVSVVMYLIFKSHYPQFGLMRIVIFAVLFSIISQIGDLVESSIKRYYGIKDSGNILPGHGGILDRFDGLIFVFPFMHMLGLF